MVHSELDAFEIVFRHLRIHPIELGGSFPTVRFDAQNGQSGVKPGLAKIPHALVEVEITRQDQPGHRRLQGRQGDRHHDIAAIDRRHQNRPRLERVQHVRHGARKQGNFLYPTGLNFTLVQHLRTEVPGDVDGATGRQLGILRNGPNQMKTSALEQAALRREGVTQTGERQLLRVRHMIDDAVR